jgi:hypothetical protein
MVISILVILNVAVITFAMIVVTSQSTSDETSAAMKADDKRCGVEVVAPLCIPCQDKEDGEGEEEEEWFRVRREEEGDLCCPVTHHQLSSVTNQVQTLQLRMEWTE